MNRKHLVRLQAILIHDENLTIDSDYLYAEKLTVNGFNCSWDRVQYCLLLLLLLHVPNQPHFSSDLTWDHPCVGGDDATQRMHV